jgi:hypothetical protein
MESFKEFKEYNKKEKVEKATISYNKENVEIYDPIENIKQQFLTR